jgi:hypothetical protein
MIQLLKLSRSNTNIFKLKSDIKGIITSIWYVFTRYSINGSVVVYQMYFLANQRLTQKIITQLEYLDCEI